MTSGDFSEHAQAAGPQQSGDRRRALRVAAAVSLSLVPLLAVAAVLFLATQADAQQQTNATPAPVEAATPPPAVPRPERALLRPDSKQPVTLQTGERNPFGLVSVPKVEEGADVAVEDETEEAKIRRVLANMRISGRSGTPGNYQVLLGPLVVRKGDLLPPLFANQAEVLRVEDITDRELTFAFVEADAAMAPRKFGISFDVSARVRSLMPGEAFSQLVSMTPQGKVDLPPVETEGVKDFLQGAEEQKFESMVDRSFELLGASARPQADENDAPEQE